MSILSERVVNQLHDFSGRSEILAAFQAMLSKTDMQILYISGQDGIGKSWLIQRLAHEAEQANAAVVIVDKRVQRPLEFMETVTSQLFTQGLALKEFAAQLKLFRQTRDEAMKEMDGPFGFYLVAGKSPEEWKSSTTSIHVDEAEDADLNEETLEQELVETELSIDESADESTAVSAKNTLEEKALDSRCIDEALRTIEDFGMVYLSTKIQNLEKSQMVIHPERVLAQVFLADLNTLTSKKRLVIFLDDYEINSVQLESWLDSLFQGVLGKIPDCVFVSASRDEFPETSWNRSAVRYRLRPFSNAELNEFLGHKNVTDTKFRDLLPGLTGNQPVLLGFLTANPLPPPNPEESYALKFIDTFLARILPKELHSELFAAALPRSFDRSILEQAYGKADERLFDWLITQPFILEQNGTYSFHPFIRTRLVQKKFSEDLTGWREIHDRLNTYFAQQLPQTALDEKALFNDEKVQHAAREQLYHRLCSSGPKYLGEALNTFLDLLEVNPYIAVNWARTIRQAGTDTLNRGVYNWGQRILLGLLGLYQNKYQTTKAMFTALAQYPGLEADKSAVITRWQAEIHRHLHQYSGALTLFDESIANEPGQHLLYALRGEIYRIRGLQEKAVEDFQYALQLKPDCAYSLSRRGEIFREMNMPEEAEKDLNLALKYVPAAAGLLVLRANIYQQTKRETEALDDLNRSLELQPNQIAALATRAEIHLQNGRLEDALRDIEKALELRPDWCWAIANRGITYLKMGFNDFAIRDFSRALQMNDKYVSILVKRATAYRKISQNESAFEDISRAIELLPDDPTLYAFRGELHQRASRFVESLADFNKAVEIDPTFVSGIAARGATYRRMSQFAEALLDFNRAAELDPSMVSVIANQGETYRRLGQYKEALECFDKAIENQPDYFWAYAGRGETHRTIKNYEGALADFNKALEINPSNTWVLSVRAVTYRYMGDYERALADLNMAIGFDPNNHSLLALRGEVHRRLNNMIRAIKDFTRALQIRPDNWTYSNRGEALFLIGRYNEALADFNMALVVYPRDSWALTYRARTYQKIKRYSKALADYSRVIDFEPDDAELRLTRGLLCQYTGNEGQAFSDFETAIEIAKKVYESSPLDASNTLHYALYHLAAGNFDQSDALFSEALSGEIEPEVLEEVMEHLNEFLYVFPDHKRALILQQKVQQRKG